MLFAGEPTKSEKEIVGTWRLVSVNGREIPGEDYIKFDADGTSQAWPVPHIERRPNAKYAILTRGYRLDKGVLCFVKNRTKDVKSRYTLAGDSLSMTSDKGRVLVYRRVENPPKPGNLEADQGSGGNG